ncbi:hypothetical protein [Bacillus sp. CDB3]|uniref:hypothetical protein n=1 Tax=Bacillus sp. CDB3 TaxID=360310 RepID=UPI0009D86501|nr:hypothetical protein [Bacillus sp. CDB3]OQR53209.1 hypothetical protein CDB3_31335 [Bacillus sp. CDB3]
MKNIYTFVVKKDNTIVNCNSYLLDSEDDAGYMANNLLGNYLEINEDVNKIEIFKYDNVSFRFIGTFENVED